MDISHGCAVARLTAGLWSLKGREYTVLPLADRGVWADILNALSGDPDMEWLMIDVSHTKVHQHAAGAKCVTADCTQAIDSHQWVLYPVACYGF